MRCKSRSEPSQKTCKLGAKDWRVVRELSDQLGIEMWMRETERILSREMSHQFGWPQDAVSLSLRGGNATFTDGAGLRLLR